MASNAQQPSAHETILVKTMQGFDVARNAAAAAAEGIASGSSSVLNLLRERESELDKLDHEVDQLVTSSITGSSAEEARTLLACLKFVIGLERIGDLLLSFSNRASTVSSRIDPEDTRDLTEMASRLEKMIRDCDEGFRKRNLDLAVGVLRSDGELDRVRNLIVLRHLENPEGVSRQESFHVLFMAQSLERAGDHAKNIAEEICHLVSGRTVRHVLRTYDKPFEQMFLDQLKNKRA